MKPSRAVFVLLSCSMLASAQPKDPVAAEALFRQGRAAIKAGKTEEGCASIAESYRLDPAPGALLSVADCAERLGKIATARQHYLDLIDLLPSADDRRGLAQKKAKALELRVPKLLLRLPEGAPEGTRVLRDGVPLGAAALGVALPVDPGKHAIEVQAPGFEPARSEVSVVERESREFLLQLGPKIAAPPASSAALVASAPLASPPASSPPANQINNIAPAPASQSKPTSGARTAGWVLVGAGGLSVGASLLLGLQVLDRKATVEAHCKNKICDADGIKAGSSGSTLAGISTVTFALGALAAGAGVYLLISNPAVEVGVGPGRVDGLVRF